MSKVIFTDIDHTVLDFNGGFENFLRRVKGIDLAPGWLGDSCRLYKVLNIDEAQADEWVHEFFLDEAFGNLRALPDASWCVPELAERGYEFIAVSACPESVDPKLRLDNLERRFGIKFLDVLHSGYGGCKADILRAYEPTIWVEDNPVNANVGHELGYRSFLLNRSFNLFAETAATRVASWYDIRDELLNG